MKTPGMVRKIDELGRIVIPSELRKSMELSSGDQVELVALPEGLLLRKFPSACVFCGRRGELLEFREQFLCSDCLRNLRKV